MADSSWDPLAFLKSLFPGNSGGTPAPSGSDPGGFGTTGIGVAPTNFDSSLVGSGGSGSSLLPSIGGAGATGAATPFGMNLGTGQLAASGLSALGNLWSSFQASNLAKQSMNFQQNAYNANLGNQIKSYNTNLGAIANARGVAENQTPDQITSYIKANSLTQ